MSAPRPAVSIVMPFGGTPDEAPGALAALRAIDREADDELILVDNSHGQAVDRDLGDVRVVDATAQRSSYYARNVGTAAATGEWVLFIDSDCSPNPRILERYFAAPIEADVGALAGEIVSDRGQLGLLARYQQDRQYLSQRRHLEDPRPYAVTANLLVRTAAWRAVGGFLEGVRSGADTDFSWRLQAAGWKLQYRPEARVAHRHRVALSSFIRVTLRYSAGRAWLNRRYPGAAPRAPAANSALRALAAMIRWLLAGDRERAAFRALDALVIVADRAGAGFVNSSRQRRHHAEADPEATGRVIVLADTFPELSETFIAAELRGLEAAGCTVQVEAARRAERQNITAAREFEIAYREDDPPHRKVTALAVLILRNPAECCRDVLERRRWRREEPVPPLRVIAPMWRRVWSRGRVHLHAHFAGGAALSALRLHRLTGAPFSVTAHAYDIFREPRNLREKLESATFVTTGCRYNVEHLRRLAPRASVHEIVMGVDAERLRRRVSYTGRRGVIGVGRLVEKKGFHHLIDAVGLLEQEAPVDQLVLVGDGPLRHALEDRASRRGIAQKVRFTGAVAPEAVRELIETADVLAMPCVVAEDGDRDSMPVAAKEALALEVPVVGTDEVGLPELITPAWGRLVPPGDVQGLAAAIAEILAFDPARRADMGRAGRRYVLEHCNVNTEAERLAQLISESRE